MHGFQILSDLRQLFPATRSVMTDQVTFDQFQAYVLSGTVLTIGRYAALTEKQATLAQEINMHHLRLEQEHIPQTYAATRLGEAILG